MGVGGKPKYVAKAKSSRYGQLSDDDDDDGRYAYPIYTYSVRTPNITYVSGIFPFYERELYRDENGKVFVYLSVAETFRTEFDYRRAKKERV